MKLNRCHLSALSFQSVQFVINPVQSFTSPGGAAFTRTEQTYMRYKNIYNRLFSTIDDDITTDSEADFATTYHAPVMWKECIDALLGCERGIAENNEQEDASQPRQLIFVDGTLGGGGHSNALLDQLGPGDIVLGCDVDSEALQTASKRLKAFTEGNKDKPHFIPVQSNFCNLANTLPDAIHPITEKPVFEEAAKVDGILLDLGVSSHQIDTAERGFAFMRDGPLDMRMSNQASGITAADICNQFDVKELQRIFSVYGDEPRSRKIATAIINHRPLNTTAELVNAVASVTPQYAKRGKRMGRTSTLARIFQSLRIVVNNEENVLEKVLSETCPEILRPGGRLVVLSYHSMEDRATKRMIRDGALERRNRSQERDIYGNYDGPPKPFAPVGKRVKATEEEVGTNPRSRSATLRVATRLD